jgi:YHS domain-containing protein
MMRQIRKQNLTITLAAAALSLWLAMDSAPQALSGSVVTSVVSNPLTGIAIDGFDPVSYFTDGQPVQGVSDYEVDWAGVPWYFSSAANRDVFIRHPEVYAPQFGGHCLMSAARGFLSDGNPRLFVIENQKLYLFYSAPNRDAFLAEAETALKQADNNWPKLSQQLSSQ